MRGRGVLGLTLAILAVAGAGAIAVAGTGDSGDTGGKAAARSLAAARSQNPKCQVLPAGDEFHRNVAGAPVHPRSSQIINRIDSMGGNSLHPDFGSNTKWGIPFVAVKPSQRGVPVKFTAYGSESDKGKYPIPKNAPVEGGKRSDGDRHVIVVRQPRKQGRACKLYELYRAFYLGGKKRKWSADAAAKFNLGRKLPQRPRGWTSADAAGLPIFPGLVRYSEVEKGRIDHAIRVTFAQTRKEYILPATHYASSSCHPNDPPMGLRLRLKAGYNTAGFSQTARVIAQALKTYGMIVADNGSNWFFSGASDRRWNDDQLSDLKQIPSSAFEVVTSPGKSFDAC